MNFEEHAAKPLLAAAGIPVPAGKLVSAPAEAREVAAELGPVVVKAQVPTGKRGKAGGIRLAGNAGEAETAARAILGMTIGGSVVERVLVERRVSIMQELYAAVLNDSAAKGPIAMFSSAGGMDIEESAKAHPEKLRTTVIDVQAGLDRAQARGLVAGLDLGAADEAVASVIERLYRVWREHDAELVEINPLARLEHDSVVALDCKFVLDDSAVKRQAELGRRGSPDTLTALEARGSDLGLKYIELDGEIGVLANGAGLTMTTMDVISEEGGRPANFLEIGGEAYTKAQPALELVLANPGVRSLVVNFCGAFARTDVMTEGVVSAWEALRPRIPVFFSIHGTGSAEARAILRERLEMEPYPTMDEAIRAAIRASEAPIGASPPEDRQ